MNSSNTKPDFEINLLPVISVLAVCISFLLLTVVWVQIGVLGVKQSHGDEVDVVDHASTPTVMLVFENQDKLRVQIKNSKNIRQKEYLVKSKAGRFDWNRIEATLSQMKDREPELIAMVLPDKNTTYKRLVRTVEALNHVEVKEIGISPY